MATHAPVQSLRGSMVTPQGAEMQDGVCEMTFEEAADGSLTINICDGTVWFDSYDTLERLIAQYKAAIETRVPEVAKVPTSVITSIFTHDLERTDEAFRRFAQR